MPMTFDEFMQAYEQQGGPLPSAWSPEAIQDAETKRNMMGIAEIKPMSKNPKAGQVAKHLDDLVNYNTYKANKNETYMEDFRKIFKKLKELPPPEMNKKVTEFQNKWESERPQKIEKLKKQLDKLNKPPQIENQPIMEQEKPANVINIEDFFNRRGGK